MMNRVINFHKVSDSDWFEKVVVFLKSRYNMISADDIINYYYHDAHLRNACLITVDDGDKTSYEVIYPILKRYQVPAIFFISPEKMLRNGKHRNFWFQEARNCKDGKSLMEKIHQGDYPIDEIWEIIDNYKSEHRVGELSDQNMTLEQVLKIDKEDLVTIGAHTLDHPFLAREDDERSKREIEESVIQLGSHLGHPVLTFAYPNGTPLADYGERETNIVRQSSLKVAFCTKPQGFSHKNSPYEIPRFGLTCGSIPFIKAKLLLGSHYLIIKSFIILFCNILKIRNHEHTDHHA